MSDERFFKSHYTEHIIDKANDKCYPIRNVMGVDDLVDLLNSLSEENEQLRGINKEIGDDLYNCRLNKDIVSEKLKLWQDTLAEYDIYTIKDFKESFELDAKINKEKGI